MIRSTVLTLLLRAVLTSALNLDHLDQTKSTKLQTIKSVKEQEIAALNTIQNYLPSWTTVRVSIDRTLFKNNKDSFKLKTLDRNTLQIQASTGVAAVWGFNYYLKKYCKSQVSWQIDSVRIPEILPTVDEEVIANDRLRYYQNVCTASYSFAWWNKSDWKNHVVWMALNGINVALAPVAQEAAWAKVYRHIGMTQVEIDNHFTGPAFLSWLRMGNVRGWGGPLPDSWNDIQTEIQNYVTDYMLSLGIIPVFPAFSGHVPAAFSRIYPNSTFYKVDQWNKFGNEYCCGLFLDPNDPEFASIGTMFLNAISYENKQDIHLYASDPFNEVKLSEFSTPFVQETAKSIFSVISNHDKDAVWLVQNWMFVHDPLLWPINRVKSFLTAVPNGRMLVLDLQSEQWPQYDVYQMYYGQPFIWCMLHNFGGTMGMFGNMVTINRDVYETRSRANSTMIGIGLTPEGINQNYVVYDLMLESAWRKSPIQNLEQWVSEYAERRYGCTNLSEAWKYLLKSVYSFNGLNRVRGKYVITRRPSLKIKPWAWYKSYDLLEAFRIFVQLKKGAGCYTTAYEYDLVDVTRQVLQYRIDQLYINVVSDRYSNYFVFEASIDRFLRAMDDMSDILNTNYYYKADSWFEKARSLGRNETEKYIYEMNARNQITLWGPNGEISDYACKQWDGLVKYYYRPRWSLFLTAALRAKRSDEVFSEKETRRVVTSNVEIPFVFTRDVFSTSERTIPIEPIADVALRIYQRWRYAPDVEDLPIIIIDTYNVSKLAEDEIEMVTLLESDSDSKEIPRTPIVTMYPTTPVN